MISHDFICILGFQLLNAGCFQCFPHSFWLLGPVPREPGVSVGWRDARCKAGDASRERGRESGFALRLKDVLGLD